MPQQWKAKVPGRSLYFAQTTFRRQKTRKFELCFIREVHHCLVWKYTFRALGGPGRSALQVKQLHLLYGMPRLRVMLPVTTRILMTSPKVLATNRGNVIVRRDAKLREEGNNPLWRRCQSVRRCWQRIFFKYPFKRTSTSLLCSLYLL